MYTINNAGKYIGNHVNGGGRTRWQRPKSHLVVLLGVDNTIFPPCTIIVEDTAIDVLYTAWYQIALLINIYGGIK